MCYLSNVWQLKVVDSDACKNIMAGELAGTKSENYPWHTMVYYCILCFFDYYSSIFAR